MKKGFSSWIISSINASVSAECELSKLLWDIFNDLFGIFKTFVMKTTLSSNSCDLNTLVDNYCKGMFVQRVLAFSPTNNLIIGSIACVVKTIFKKSFDAQ